MVEPGAMLPAEARAPMLSLISSAMSSAPTCPVVCTSAWAPFVVRVASTDSGLLELNGASAGDNPDEAMRSFMYASMLAEVVTGTLLSG